MLQTNSLRYEIPAYNRRVLLKNESEIGDGEGETAGKPQAVSASDKLATTWGTIKRRL